MSNFTQMNFELQTAIKRSNERDKIKRDLKSVGIKFPSNKYIQKIGYVYFLQDTLTGHIKIGWAKYPHNRLLDLQTGSAGKLKLLGAFEGTIKDEKLTQRLMNDQHLRGEWFNYNENIIQYIKEKNTLCS